MTRDAAERFVQRHVVQPAVQRVVQALNAAPRPPDSPALPSTTADVCFGLARETTDRVIRAATSRLLASAGRSSPAVATSSSLALRLEAVADLAARNDVARVVIDAVVRAAVDLTPSRRHHNLHRHHTHTSDKQPHHLTAVRELACRVYTSEILPAASDRVASSKRKRRRPPPTARSDSTEDGGQVRSELAASSSDPAPAPPPAISNDQLRAIAGSLVADATAVAIQSVAAASPAVSPVVPGTETDAVAPDNTEPAPVPEPDAMSANVVENNALPAPSPVVSPSTTTKPSPRRKRHAAKTKDRAKDATASVPFDSPPSPSTASPSLLPPIKLPSSPRVDHAQPTPRTVRTATAAIESPRSPPSPPRSGLLLPPVVATPRSSTAQASLAAIYQPSAPRPPLGAPSKPLRHPRQPPEPPVASPRSPPQDKSRRRDRHRDKTKPPPSGYCQRCALDGRACKLRECAKHQPLRLPPVDV